jgi:transcriptional regulator with XRE-family HTH domain
MPRRPKYKLKLLKDNHEKIGIIISRIRKERGMSQLELAEKIGISRKLVTDYETGRIRLYDEMVTMFAIALKVTPDVLLGLKNFDYKKPLPSLRVMRRMREIDELPETRKKSILKTIDDLIRANR